MCDKIKEIGRGVQKKYKGGVPKPLFREEKAMYYTFKIYDREIVIEKVVNNDRFSKETIPRGKFSDFLGNLTGSFVFHSAKETNFDGLEFSIENGKPKLEKPLEPWQRLERNYNLPVELWELSQILIQASESEKRSDGHPDYWGQLIAA